MNRRFSVSLLVATLLAVLAGCATAPTQTTTEPAGDETFEFELDGTSSATYFVSADLVAEPLESVTVTYENGSNGTIETPQTNGVHSFGNDSRVTDVDHDADVVGGAYFEGTPRFAVTDREVPAAPSAVYTVRTEGEETLVAWGVARCDRHVTRLSLDIGSGTPGVGVGCES